MPTCWSPLRLGTILSVLLWIRGFAALQVACAQLQLACPTHGASDLEPWLAASGLLSLVDDAIDGCGFGSLAADWAAASEPLQADQSATKQTLAPASMSAQQVVLDTNVFVGAGFKPRSHSALLLDAVRDGRLRMVWDDVTRDEIEHVLRRIPPLSWGTVAELFREEDRFDSTTHPDQFGYVPDPTDRKFAALADAANVPLVTSDRGLLNARVQARFPILKPSEFALDR